MAESTGMVRRAEAATAQLAERSSLLPSAETLTTMLTMSDALHKSGLLPAHIKTPQAAFAVIQKGLELGIPPMYAMSNIAVIQGKPTANAELMLALIYRDHGDGAILFKETDATKCIIAYKRRAWSEYKLYPFTIQDARTAKLLSNQTWEKYPAAMLRARCISAVARLAFPDSIAGMYTPEELGAAVHVTDDGEMTLLPESVTTDGVIEPEPVSAEDYGRSLAGRVEKRDGAYLITDGELLATVRQVDGVAVCNCEDYRLGSEGNPKYKCAHKWAVSERIKLDKELDARAASEAAR
jgi:RecT family